MSDPMSHPEGPIVSKDPLWRRLYRGDTHIDVIGHRRRWFLLSAVLLLLSAGSLTVRGLNLGIEFEGGSVWEIPAGDASVADARDAVAPLGLEGATIQSLETDSGSRLRVATGKEVDSDAVTAALEEVTGESIEGLQEVGPSWGREITEKARTALLAFLALVTVYIGFRFQLKSALGAMVALVHDVVITVGVYSIGQFPVTPATVIAFLTILGYSLYDTVVVFDKIKENNQLVSANGTLTYGAMVNLTLNQTLMRSVNTTLTSMLPVGSLLVIGSWVMGAATLQDFALALLVGMIAGTYSSFFVAAPLLVMLKEREPVYRKIRERVAAQGADITAVPDRIGATEAARSSSARRPLSAPAGASPKNGGGETTITPGGRVIPARPRKKTRRR